MSACSVDEPAARESVRRFTSSVKMRQVWRICEIVCISLPNVQARKLDPAIRKPGNTTGLSFDISIVFMGRRYLDVIEGRSREDSHSEPNV